MILLSALVLAMSSCSLERYVPEGKYLVKKNTIVIENDSTNISKSDLSNYISLKPYKETLSSDIPFQIYYKAKKRPNSKFWGWLNRTAGKEPSFYEKADANYSAKQMSLYLGNIGYPNSKVSSSVQTKRHKATVTYTVKPSRPYRISKIDYNIEDSIIARYVMRFKDAFPVKVGDIYNAYTMNTQREQITEYLRNAGYYFFTRDNIHYNVDSSFNNHTMEVTMCIAHNELASRRYYINDINIYPNFTLSRMNDIPSDSIILTTEVGRRKFPNKLNFLYFGKPNVKPETITQSINILKGSPYRQQNVSLTYNGLNNFQIFGNPNIEFDTVPNDSLYMLDCKITMQQNDTRSFTVQAEGTNSDGDLGIKGSLSFTNRNIFHGAEVFQLSLKAGLEAQTINMEITDEGVFNTKELGISGSLLFPRFISPIPFRDFARDYQPTTNLTLGFNSQIRYYYTRHIVNTSYSYDWKSNKLYRHTLTPLYINTVKISNMKPIFEELLNQEHNQRKKDQYTSHLLLGLKYSFVLNTQNLQKQNSFVYFRADFETSGNLISLFNNTKLITTDEGYHELFGIRYGQYVRSNFDFRQHVNLKNDHWLVFREFIGLGIPYGNSKDLPFERSFYAGGTSSMRGWNYRGVGPGGYVPTNDDLEKIGDLQLELNFEYRFPIYNIVNGAFFVDAGNVWTYWPNAELPEGEFKFNKFYKQIALDAGIGIRLDLSFLIVRIDLARALRNPYKNANGQYWRFDYGENYENSWRLIGGIGFPF